MEAMKIIGIEVYPFRLPLRRNFRWASLVKSLGRFVFVEIHTDQAMSGIGETIPLPDWGGDRGRPSGETPGTVIDIILGTIAPALIGLDPTGIEAAHQAMDRVVRGHFYARCAIDIALHDLLGQVCGQPLYRLLGGPMRSHVAIAHMIGIMPVDEAVEEARGALADGITAFQIKGGEDAVRDLAVVKAVRAVSGSETFLRLDANQGYRHAKQAKRVLASMVGLIDMVEQPVLDRFELAALTRETDIDVIADESCWDAHDAIEVVTGRLADAISIYLAKAGGIAPARRVAAVAMAGGMPCDVNGSLESGIGNAANLHFALATPAVTLASVIPVNAPAGQHTSQVAGRYFEDDVITQPFVLESGGIRAPEGPGLGIVLDRQRLERYRDG
jgi:L-alanine-DL-glutamate epimerase-like enolase superfamily enzyme